MLLQQHEQDGVSSWGGLAILSAIVGIIAVFGGLLASLQWDTPAGPSIVVASSVLFILTVLPVISIQMLGVEWNKKIPT